MILFPHITRTGGSKIHAELRPYFSDPAVPFEPREDLALAQGHRALIFVGSVPPRPVIASALEAPVWDRYLGGHFTYADFAAFFDRRRPGDVLFSTTRDPVERVASLHALVLRSPDWLPDLAEVASKRSFAEFYEHATRNGAVAPNQQCTALSGQPDSAHAIDVLRRHYDIVGTYRHYGAFLRALETRLQGACPGLAFSELRNNPALHKSTDGRTWATDAALDALIDPATRARIEQDNAEDLALIRHIESAPGGVLINVVAPAQRPTARPAPDAPATPTQAGRRCVLHIGTEKTGTSTIQHFLSANREALARDGIVYPRFTGPRGGSQWGFTAVAMDCPWKSDIGVALDIRSEQDAANYRKQLAAALTEELHAVEPANTLLISSEHFHSRLDTRESIARLKSFLAPWAEEFEVMLYLRRQDRVALSHYSTKIKSGNPEPAVFPSADEDGLPYYYDYERIFANWAGVFGEAAIRVRLFEREELKNGDLITDFCETAGISAEGLLRPGTVNESLNLQGMHFLTEVNRQIPKTDGRSTLLRDRLVAFVSKQCAGKSYPVARDEARAFEALFAESNRRLAARVFPQRQRPLFDDDFDAYPVEPARSERRYEDAVALAVRMLESSENILPPPPPPFSLRSALTRWLSHLRQRFVPERDSRQGERVGGTQQAPSALLAEKHFLQGMLALENGNRGRAAARFRRAVRIDPGHARAQNELRKLEARRNKANANGD